MRDRKLLNIELGRISAEEYRAARKTVAGQDGRRGGSVVVVLDNIRSAHNVGSVFRTADAFGVDLVCLCGICAVPPSALIHKSALGAEDSVPWKHYDSTLDALTELRDAGYTIASVEQTVHSVRLDELRREDGRRYALVLGNEVDGVQQEVVDASDLCLEIPQWGTKHSLNVSVAAGVVLWTFKPTK